MIHGLYLLLRCTGLGKIISKGKESLLIIDPTRRSDWAKLNPTEKYFTLLEAWLIRGNHEIVGEPGGRSNCSSYVTQWWPSLSIQGEKFAKHNDQEMFQYSPGLMNLALMQLFGFVEIVSAKPEIGKGWRFKSVKPLPWGDAVVQLVAKADWDKRRGWNSETDITLAFGELQSCFKPYFPAWKRNLLSLVVGSQSGVFTFKVSVREVWRRIAIGSEMPLSDLADLILDSVDFDRDHLDMFTYKDPLGRRQKVMHPAADGRIATTEVKVGTLPIEPGGTLDYMFDFGDCWRFGLQLESIVPGDAKNQGEILEAYGDSPVQYPDWDE
jgi:Plasmid pRiA4b ORF-3-like protein